MRNYIQIIDPTINRGTPPRDLTVEDVIWVAVKRPGTFNLGDMLSLTSITNLWIANANATERQVAQVARKRAPHKN